MIPGLLKAQKALNEFEEKCGFPVYPISKYEIQTMKDTPTIRKVIRTVNTADGAKKYGISWDSSDPQANKENNNENL